MYKDSKIELIKAVTPMHVGSGQDLGMVDMPIQREKNTNIPKIEASSLKGAIKHHLYHKLKAEDKGLDKLYTYFGLEDDSNQASHIAFTDAKLLFFPIKSFNNIFTLITCPYILKRFMRDYSMSCKTESKNLLQEIDFDNLNVEVGKGIFEQDENLILEEYVIEKMSSDNKSNEILDKIKNLNLTNGENQRIAIISDSDFIDFVTMYTEIITRNKIDPNTGTNKNGGLFTEEYLPAESILYYLTLYSPRFNKDSEKDGVSEASEFYKNMSEVFQIGGNETLGKGIVKKYSLSEEE